jgi:hypothetical protein
MLVENVFIGNPIQKGDVENKSRSKIEDEFMISNVPKLRLFLPNS